MFKINNNALIKKKKILINYKKISLYKNNKSQKKYNHNKFITISTSNKNLK